MPHAFHTHHVSAWTCHAACLGAPLSSMHCVRVAACIEVALGYVTNVMKPLHRSVCVGRM